jgi:hypothetical protein
MIMSARMIARTAERSLFIGPTKPFAYRDFIMTLTTDY